MNLSRILKLLAAIPAVVEAVKPVVKAVKKRTPRA